MSAPRSVLRKLLLTAGLLLLSTVLFAAAMALHFLRMLPTRYIADELSTAAAVLMVTGGALILWLLALILALLAWLHFKRTEGSGLSGFAFLVVSVFTTLQFLGVISQFQTMQDDRSTLQSTEETGLAEVTWLRTGAVSVDGPIGAGLLDLIRNLDTDETPIQTLVVNSGGGFIGEAMSVADYVSERKMNVVIGDQCMSACTLIAFASKNIFMHKNSLIGFHQPYDSFPLSSQFWRWMARDDAQENWDQLKANGVPNDIIEEARKKGPDELLEFTGQQLLDRQLIRGMIADYEELGMNFETKRGLQK